MLTHRLSPDTAPHLCLRFPGDAQYCSQAGFLPTCLGAELLPFLLVLIPLLVGMEDLTGTSAWASKSEGMRYHTLAAGCPRAGPVAALWVSHSYSGEACYCSSSCGLRCHGHPISPELPKPTGSSTSGPGSGLALGVGTLSAWSPAPFLP